MQYKKKKNCIRFAKACLTKFLYRWKSAAETLADYHKVDRFAVGLGDFGKSGQFYNRQIKTFSTISNSQAESVDIVTGEKVGSLPHFKDAMEWLQNHQPNDKITLVHGDYKIDNMIFHPTEPRVIGVLDWELATVGHPLSDVINLTMPWLSARSATAVGNSSLFIAGVTPGLPSREQVIKWYSDRSGYDPTPDLTFGDAFGIIRGAVIMQGIAARKARGQASSEKANSYGKLFVSQALRAWEMIQNVSKSSKL